MVLLIQSLRMSELSLAGTTAAVQEEVKRIGERAESDYRAAQNAETNLKADYERQRAAADQLNNKAVEYSIAKQEAAESRGLYETLYQHLKEAGVIEGLRSSNVTVVDPGRVPAKPASLTFQFIWVSQFLAVFFRLTRGTLFRCIDNRVQSMEMIERSLNTPLLGVIPNRALSGRGQGSNSSPRTQADD